MANFLNKILDFSSRSIKAVENIYHLVRNPLTQTYYPEQLTKSGFEVLMDNLWWLFKYKEINKLYYPYGFDRKNGPDRTEYISAHVFFVLQRDANIVLRRKFNAVDYRCLLKDKFLFGAYLDFLKFPTPKMLALCDINGIKWSCSQDYESFDALVGNKNLDAFCKQLLGRWGQGAFALKSCDGKVFINGVESSVDEFKSKVMGLTLIQQRIRQHPKLSELHPQSVNTIRLATAIVNGKPQELLAAIKVGTGQTNCDNWASGGLLGGVDLTTGRVSEDFFYKPGIGKRTQVHPDTGIVFRDFEVPFFHKAVEMAKKLHCYFYGVHSIGWDIAITSDGPIFVEGNDEWEGFPHQIHEGGMRKKFYQVFQTGK